MSTDDLNIVIKKELVILVFCVLLVGWKIGGDSIHIQMLALTLSRWLKRLMVFWIWEYVVTLELHAAFYVRIYFHPCWAYVFVYYFNLRIKRLLIILSKNVLGFAWFFPVWLIDIVNFRVLIIYFFLINNNLFFINILILLWVLNIIFKDIDFLRNWVCSLLKLIIMLTVGRIIIWIIVLNLYFLFYLYYILSNIIYLLAIDFILIFILITLGIAWVCLIHFIYFLNCNRVG